MYSSISRRRVDGVGKKLANIAYKHISSFGHQRGQLKENFPGSQTPEHFTSRENNGLCLRCFKGVPVTNSSADTEPSWSHAHGPGEDPDPLLWRSPPHRQQRLPFSPCSEGTGARGADTEGRQTATAAIIFLPSSTKLWQIVSSLAKRTKLQTIHSF